MWKTVVFVHSSDDYAVTNRWVSSVVRYFSEKSLDILALITLYYLAMLSSAQYDQGSW
jgi:hypothetical protein